MSSYSVLSHSAAATQRIGECIGRVLQPCDAVLLIGDMGAGKTQFVHGVARALGVDDPVSSPTFLVVQEYEICHHTPLLHVDLYRLDSADAIDALAIDEYVQDGAIALIEWGDKATALLRNNALVIRFSMESDDVRRLEIVDDSGFWDARIEAVRKGVSC